jgi:cytochrome b subunit of formate dehydrogenase
MIKKLILGSLGGLVTGSIVSTIIFMGLMGSKVEEWMQENAACLHEMSPVGMIAGSLVLSVFITILLMKFEITTFMEGAKASAWVTFFVILWYGIFNASTFTAYGWDWLPLDVVGNVVTSAFAGGVAGWILGKVK